LRDLDVPHSPPNGTLDPARELVFRWRVSDGTRTRDRLDHNQELYLLSYAHRETF
jgi:hypothetical protein